MLKITKKRDYYDSKFEKVINDCFIAAGYSTERHTIVERHSESFHSVISEIDIVATKGSDKYYVELKMTKMYEHALTRLSRIKEYEQGKPKLVLITAQILSPEERHRLNTQFTGLIIFDLTNLLYILKNDETLRKDLIASLDNAVPNNIELIEPAENLFDNISNSNLGAMELVDELLKVPNGKNIIADLRMLVSMFCREYFTVI